MYRNACLSWKITTCVSFVSCDSVRFGTLPWFHVYFVLKLQTTQKEVREVWIQRSLYHVHSCRLLNPSRLNAGDSGDSTLKQEQEQGLQGNTTSVPWNIKPRTAVNFDVILMRPGVNSSVKGSHSLLHRTEYLFHLPEQHRRTRLAQFSVSSSCSNFTGIFCQIHIDTDPWELMQLVLV